MAIDPLVIVDDDGSGATGTVFNAALVAQLEANIDAAIDGADASVRSVALGGTGLSALGTALQVLRVNAGATALEYGDAATGGNPTEQTTSATGAQNNFDLDAEFTFLRCTGAAPVFSGFTVNGSAPTAGCRVIIHCIGTTAKVAHQDTGSTDVNRIIAVSTTGQIVGLGGTIELIYDGTTNRWRIDDVHPGKAIDVAFSAGNFTASAGDWTLTSPDQVVFRYQQEGRRVYLEFNFNNTTVSATPNGLRFALAATTGFTVSGRVLQPCRLDDNGTASLGQADFNSVESFVQLSKLSGNWSTATDNTGASGNFFVMVN